MSIAEERHQEIDLAAQMAEIGRAARGAARELAMATTAAKNQALSAQATALRDRAAEILDAYGQDMAAAEAAGLSAAMLDRLKLNGERIEAMAGGLESIAELADPVGAVIASWSRPNGLQFERVRVPLGVIGIIYESRPNVTADAGALCLKAGNAVILRGGSESFRSSGAILACLVDGLNRAGLPEAAIQRLPTRDRAAVGILLGMAEFVDIIVPRGGKSLIERVQRESRIPVLAHLEGNCHVYIDRAADLEMACDITLNAKMRRTGICGAAETLLVDAQAPASHLAALVKTLLDAGCEVRGDEPTQAIDSRVRAAVDEDWGREYLEAIIAVRVVDGVEAAIDHISRHGSHHTECIVTGDNARAAKFLGEIDSAILLHNASTQYADGGEFGMGAEIGISTGRLHARGPVGVEELTSYKYIVRGNGQVRP